jgi:hypothetical protein
VKGLLTEDSQKTALLPIGRVKNRPLECFRYPVVSMSYSRRGSDSAAFQRVK